MLQEGAMKFTRDNVTLELVTFPNSKQKKYKVAINFKNFSRDFVNMPIIDKFVSESFYDEKEAEKVRNFILSMR